MAGNYWGRLFLPGQEDDSLQALVEVGADQLSLTANQQSLGTWPLGDCTFERTSADTFRLTLGTEVVYFEPDEPLSFAAMAAPTPALADRIRQVKAVERPKHAAPGSVVEGSAASVLEWIKTHRLTAGVLVFALLVVFVGVAGGIGSDPVDDSDDAGITLAEETTTSTAPPTTATTAGAATTGATTLNTTAGSMVGGETVTVVSITDGDTIDVQFADGTIEPLRLIGMNAPEGGECMAAEATAYLTDLVDGQQVGLLVDVSDRDQYDRLLRYVYLGDLFVNEDLVRNGYAIARRYEPDTAMAATLEAAQTAAQDSGMGMWAPSACGPASTTALEIIEVEYDAPGDDNLNLNGEWVIIANPSDTPADLTGWVIKDESASHRYHFPTGFVLLAGEQVTVFTGCGDDFSTDLYWCNTGSAVWNNTGDTAFLLDPSGNITDFWQYGASATTTTRATTTTTRATTTTGATTTPRPATTTTAAANCDPSYPDVCIPPYPPDLDCGDISYRRFTVLPPDPHGFDGDHDGIGCES